VFYETGLKYFENNGKNDPVLFENCMMFSALLSENIGI
jgi:hypothetical protein